MFNYSGLHSGLQVLDISNPAAPQRLGGWQPPDGNYLWGGGAVAGQYAYVGVSVGPSGTSGTGLAVIDLDPPANLLRVGSLDTPGYARTFTSREFDERSGARRCACGEIAGGAAVAGRRRR